MLNLWFDTGCSNMRHTLRLPITLTSTSASNLATIFWVDGHHQNSKTVLVTSRKVNRCLSQLAAQLHTCPTCTKAKHKGSFLIVLQKPFAKCSCVKTGKEEEGSEWKRTSKLNELITIAFQEPGRRNLLFMLFIPLAMSQTVKKKYPNTLENEPNLRSLEIYFCSTVSSVILIYSDVLATHRLLQTSYIFCVRNFPWETAGREPQTSCKGPMK